MSEKFRINPVFGLVYAVRKIMNIGRIVNLFETLTGCLYAG